MYVENTFWYNNYQVKLVEYETHKNDQSKIKHVLLFIIIYLS